MSRAPLFVAAALILAGAWVARAREGVAPGVLDPGAYSALDDGEAGARLRAAELALALGGSPQRDRAIEFPSGMPLPWPPLVHGGLARVAGVAIARGDGPVELRGVDEESLLRIANRLAPLAGLAATALAFLLGAGAARGTPRIAPACAAAAVYAFIPTAVGREWAGSLESQPWIALFSFTQLAALSFALRAEQRVDSVLGALLAGLSAGLAMLAGSEAWPLPLAALAVLIAVASSKPREGARDAWRTALCFGAVAVTVLGVGEPGPALARVAPDFAGGARAGALLHAAPVALAAVVCALPLLAGVWRAPRQAPEKVIVLATAFLSLACALFDRRFLATANVALAASAASCVAAWPELRRRARLGAVALGLIFVAGSAAPYLASQSARREHGSQRSSIASAMRWLRDHSASPGPFNHPDGELDWCVLAPAEIAGAVLFHARRPVALAPRGDVSHAREAELAPILRGRDDAALAAWLDRERARFVVAVPQLVRDGTLGGGGAVDPASVAARLALADAGGGNGELSGLERVYASPSWVTPGGQVAAAHAGAGPAVSIWRRTSVSDAEPGTRASSVR